MKVTAAFLLILWIQLFTAQNVLFNKIESTSLNTDQFLYLIDKGNPDAKFLAEIAIQGYSPDHVATFKKIVAKAKEVGANAFAYQPFLKIDENDNEFDAAHYKLNLYYLDRKLFPKQNNEVILIASAKHDQTVNWNKEKLVLRENSFQRLKLEPGEVNKFYQVFNLQPGDKSGLLKCLKERFSENAAYTLFGKFMDENEINYRAFKWT